MNSGYWQVELDQKDKMFIRRTKFVVLKVLPFGFNNAPATFKRHVIIVLAGHHWKTCLVWMI